VTGDALSDGVLSTHMFAYIGCPAQVAEQCFGKAASLAPEFAFASGNQALALFQLGETDRAVRQMR
jgi:hypothetical protein